MTIRGFDVLWAFKARLWAATRARRGRGGRSARAFRGPGRRRPHDSLLDYAVAAGPMVLVHGRGARVLGRPPPWLERAVTIELVDEPYQRAGFVEVADPVAGRLDAVNAAARAARPAAAA